MTFLTWLHLSDLHMCKVRTGWDARRVLGTLQADLRHMQTRHGLHPNLIFFTGDAAFGQIGSRPGETIAEQFTEAHSFFEGVRTAFSPVVEQDNVFLVPGNHDVNRSLITPMETMWLDQQKSLDEVIALVLRTDLSCEAYMRRLEAYRNFLGSQGYGHLLQDPDRLTYALTRYIGGRRIGITGLNSAWSCGREGERGRLWSGGRWQIGQLLSEMGDVDVSIALIHHPGGWLVEYEEPALSQEIAREFDFHLHGHEHQGWVDAKADGHVRVAAAAVYDGSERENGYNFVRLNLETREGEVWLRRYDRDGGGWIPRVVAGKTDNDGMWPLRHLRFKVAAVSAPGAPYAGVQSVQEVYSPLNARMEQFPRLLSVADTSDSHTSSEQAWNQRIDIARNLLNEGQYQAARPLLISLREEANQSRPAPAIRSRIANNLGACALGADEIDEAQGYFQEALAHEPGSPKALSNLAMVMLIRGDYEQALYYSTQAWEADATDPGVLGVHIQALHRMNRTEEAERLIRDNAWAMERDECAAAIAVIWRDLGRYGEAEALARRAMRASPNDAHLRVLLASLIVIPIQNDLRATDGPKDELPLPVVARLEEAEQAHNQAITLFEQQGNRPARRNALVSRSGIRLLLLRGGEGLDDCEQVLREEPSNHNALENIARILLALERPADAIPHLETLLGQTRTAPPDYADEPDAAPPERFPIVALLADAYIGSGQSDKVPPLLSPFWKPGAQEPNQRYVAELLLSAYAEVRDTVAAAEVLHCLELDYPGDPRAQAIMAEYYVRAGDLSQAVPLYQEAADHAEPAWKSRFSVRLGHLYHKLREYRKAVEAFAPFVDVGSELYDIRAFITCLYHGGSRVEALRLAREYRLTRGCTPVIAEIEVAVLEEAGSLTEAKSVWQQLIAAEPREMSYHIQLAFVEMRLGERQNARETLLRVHLEDIKDSAKALLDAARLRAALQMPDVLVFAYRARQIAPGDTQVHGEYVRLCMDAGQAETEAATLAPSEVRIGDAVRLTRNGKTTTFVILDEKPIHAERGQMTADDPRAKSLLGKRIGDTVSLGDGLMGGQEYQVAEIMSKYVYASHETMRLLEEGTLHLPDIAVGDVTDPDFMPCMLDRADRQSEQATRIMAAYDQQPIPLSALAAMRHRSTVETWLALTNRPGSRLFAFAGTEEDAQAQAGLISSAQDVVLDLLTVLSIVHLGIEGFVADRFRKIMVAQSLLDELHQEEHDLSGQEPSATMGSVNGQRYAFELPVGHTRPHLELVQKALQFVGTFTQVMGVIGLVNADKEEVEALGRMTMASILLASEQQVPLYSDDLRTRMLAHQRWEVTGFDTQGVLADLHMRNALANDSYYRLLATLSQSNYHFVRLNAEGLLSILEQNALAITAEVRSAFKSFRGPDCAEEGAVSILAEVTAKVWYKSLMPHQKGFVLDLVLETLVAGRSLRILAAFRAHLPSKFRFATFYIGEIDQHIKAWASQRIELL